MRIFRQPWPVAGLLVVGAIAATASVGAAGEMGEKDRQIAETILLYQRDNGGWPKNYERSASLSQADKERVRSEKDREDTTFDNGATHEEMKRLAKAYAASGDARYSRAFLRGLDFTLAAQYENGGWPQFYPRPSGYHAHITFNDGAMVGALQLLTAIARGDEDYGFVGEARRANCRKAVAKGVRCILDCQIEVDGKKAAWCAQHDAATLAPQKARSYELASLSGAESVGIVRYLMTIDQPTSEIVAAVQAAVAWFNAAKLIGIRLVKKVDQSAPKGYDKVVVRDASAPPLWARFYEIGDNAPIFCSRDGVPKKTLAEISYERRNGYSWYSNSAAGLLSKDYPRWQKQWAPGRNVLEGTR